MLELTPQRQDLLSESGKQLKAHLPTLEPQWQQFLQNQPRLHSRGFTGPKLVRIDLQPCDSTQAPDRRDI